MSLLLSIDICDLDWVSWALVVARRMSGSQQLDTGRKLGLRRAARGAWNARPPERRVRGQAATGNCWTAQLLPSGSLK